MEMQRILAMQRAFQQRPQNPQITLAQQQGQIMGANYNPSAGIEALRAKFSGFAGRQPGPVGPVARPPINPATLPYLLGRERKPQPGGPLPPAVPVGQPNPGIDAMRNSFAKVGGNYGRGDGPYRRQPFRDFGNLNQQIP